MKFRTISRNSNVTADLRLIRDHTQDVQGSVNKADVDSYLGKAIQDEYKILKQSNRADISSDASRFFPPMNGTIG